MAASKTLAHAHTNCTCAHKPTCTLHMRIHMTHKCTNTYTCTLVGGTSDIGGSLSDLVLWQKGQEMKLKEMSQ